MKLIEIVNARVWMIEPPIEPVILQREHFLQLPASERSRYRLSFEVPGAIRFRIDHLKLTTTHLLKELQPPPINSSLKCTHRSTVNAQRNDDRRRPNHIDDRALLLQRGQRIRR